MRSLVGATTLLPVLLRLGGSGSIGFVTSFTASTSSSPSSYPSRIRTKTSRSPSSSLSTPLSMSIPNAIDTLTSGLASICRLPNGVTVLPPEAIINSSSRSPGLQQTPSFPPRLVALYDIENSPACRQVRERITELDLVVETVIPATDNSRVFNDPDYEYALPTTGTVIPRLVVVGEKDDDGGRETTLSGAEEILNYLDSFVLLPASPDDKSAAKTALAYLLQLGNYVAVALRVGRGGQVSAAALGPDVPRPEQPLVLYSYEGNQFCRLVREVLTELDLPYELRSAGKMSPRREELAETSGGSTQCPYLLDPNRDTAMAESADIIRYLYKNYARWTPPNELLQWTSTYVMSLAKPLFRATAPLQAGKDSDDYLKRIAKARADIEVAIRASPVVIYTYGLSPFSSETKALLENLDIEYTEISLGAEWIPGFIKEGGAETRAALLEMTGQSSLPHVFVGGTSIGGLFSGTPGVLPALEQGIFLDMLTKAQD